jgi:membrane-associated phospholipid phosphatase
MNDKFLLTGIFSAGLLLWVALNARAARYNMQTRLDETIPFLPQFAFAYLAIFILLPIAALKIFLTPLGTEYLLSMVLGIYSAALPWYFFPGKSNRPEILGASISEKLVRSIYTGNPHANTFPSIHVFSSCITAYYLSLLFAPWSLAFYFAALLISLSTLFIKQHHVLDVLAGILWATVSVALAHTLVNL